MFAVPPCVRAEGGGRTAERKGHGADTVLACQLALDGNKPRRGGSNRRCLVIAHFKVIGIGRHHPALCRSWLATKQFFPWKGRGWRQTATGRAHKRPKSASRWLSGGRAVGRKDEGGRMKDE